jgi:hypothetical protein
MNSMTPPEQEIQRVSRVPATIRIGVTGHRDLTDEQKILVSNCVKKVLDTLDRWLSDNLKNSSHAFVVISPLAEGADRIVATEVLDWARADPHYKSEMEVAIPFPVDEYVKTFTGQRSLDEFDALLKRARSVKVLEKSKPVSGAYVSVGHYVVHSSDVLIAVWNGRPANGQGGTGNVVEYARSLGQSIFIIDPVSGSITEEWNRSWTLDSLKYLDVYNSEKLGTKELTEYMGSRFRSLEKKAKSTGLPQEVVEPISAELLPKYARASLLAKRYQRYYLWAGGLIYLLSALAVTMVAIQILFIDSIFNGPPILIWVEFFMILTILVLMWALEHFMLHRRWIDYRFLAERLRIAIFLSMAGIEFKPLKYPSNFSLSHQSDYWIVKAFGWALHKRPPTSTRGSLEASKKFLLEAWIDDQISFYEKKYEKNEQRTKVLDITGYTLFLITLVAALTHATNAERFFPGILENSNYITFIAIVFPMVGALLVGFQVHREYKRNAERYKQMVGPLFSISRQIRLAKDDEALANLLENANDLMLKENQDWRVSILSQKIGV